MLILSRKMGESLFIADGLIEVQIVGIKGDKVRVGITAPMDIPVVRGELRGKEAEAGLLERARIAEARMSDPASNDAG